MALHTIASALLRNNNYGIDKGNIVDKVPFTGNDKRNLTYHSFTLIFINTASASNVLLRARSRITGTGGSLHPAAKLTPHPRYDYYTLDFDIAVARVGKVLFHLSFLEGNSFGDFQHFVIK
jgi:hypothetical protein